jgi:hypothetical protein
LIRQTGGEFLGLRHEAEENRCADPAGCGGVYLFGFRPGCRLQAPALEGELSPAVFASFSNHVRDAGLPLAVFTQLKPFMAAMTLEVVELLKKKGWKITQL